MNPIISSHIFSLQCHPNVYPQPLNRDLLHHIEMGELSQYVQKFAPFWIFSQDWNQEKRALLLLEVRIKIWVRKMLPTMMNFLLAPFPVTQ